MSLNSKILNLSKDDKKYPKLPDIGYYDTSDLNKDDEVSSANLLNNLNQSCSFINTEGNITDSNTLPSAINGKILGDNQIFKNLFKGTSFSDTSVDRGTLITQINYLACQLAQARSRTYDSNNFNTTGGDVSIKKIFDQFSNLKPYLVLVFIITMYLFVNGMFSSLDLVGNIFSIIEKNSSLSIEYWVGLLIGLAVPMIILCSLFVGMVCENIGETQKFIIRDKSNEKQCKENFDNNSTTPPSEQSKNATDNSKPNGGDSLKSIPPVVQNLDASIIALFIFIIYCFVAVLFTVKRNQVGNFLYTLFTSIILFILAIFFYLLYAYIPFFSTGDNNPTKSLQLFIDPNEKSEKSDDVSNITSNQQQTSKVKQVFMITTAVVVFVAILFFVKGSTDKSQYKGFFGRIINFFNDFLDGFLGSGAILVIPILWVFNFILAIRYFYFFPIILIGVRFIRYFGMFSLYLISQTPEFQRVKDGFSDDLTQTFDNFENYSPSWGLLGFGLLKSFLNVLGFENIFSKDVLGDDELIKNLSDNKFISGGVFRFLKDVFDNPNYKGIALFSIMAILTIVISMIVLYGVVKI
jgi:hypothetical protein